MNCSDSYKRDGCGSGSLSHSHNTPKEMNGCGNYSGYCGDCSGKGCQ